MKINNRGGGGGGGVGIKMSWVEKNPKINNRGRLFGTREYMRRIWKGLVFL